MRFSNQRAITRQCLGYSPLVVEYHITAKALRLIVRWAPHSLASLARYPGARAFVEADLLHQSKVAIGRTHRPESYSQLAGVDDLAHLANAIIDLQDLVILLVTACYPNILVWERC